ncbi:MAG: type II toxin-antitoxin system HicB family antitoxin [Desulfococcaceae bacterium]
MNPVIHFDIKVPVNIFRGETAYVSYCHALDVSSQGDTPEEAKSNLIEAVTGFIIACYETGTLSQVLKDCGFVPVSVSSMPDDPEPEGDFIEIPLPLMLYREKLKECRA